MHLLERYALNTGAKIEKAYIREDYFPMDIEKYITFHPIGAPNKHYSHWQEVINLLHPILEKEGIKILQIGGREKEQRTFNNTLNVLGQTSISQLAYLIRRGALHLGIDSFPVQLAGHYDKEVVAVYSHVKPAHRKPYWGTPEKQVLIEPDRGGRKPSYSVLDPLRSIDGISPSKIASKVCELLGLEFDYEYQSVFIGENYNHNAPDLVLDTLNGNYNINASSLRVRMDWHHDEKALVNMLHSVPSKCEVIINKKIDLNVLKAIADKIGSLIIHYDGDNLNTFDEQYFDTLNMFPFNVGFVSYENKKKNNNFKLKYMDSAVLICKDWPKKEDAGIEGIEGQVYCKSSRRILSNGKVYNSYYSYINDKPTEDEEEILPVIDDELFWRDLTYFNLLKK